MRLPIVCMKDIKIGYFDSDTGVIISCDHSVLIDGSSVLPFNK